MKNNFFLCGGIKILLLCTLLTTHLSAQFVEPKFDEISPLLVSKCIFQDIYGFIWIGDEGGLVKYDGYNLKRYRHIPFDSTSLSSDYITAIDGDNKGNLWIGTSDGLNFFDQKTETFKQYKNDKSNPNTIGTNQVNSILVNDDGSIWLGTQDIGLIAMTIDSNGIAAFKNYDLNVIPDPPVPTGDNYILDLHMDREGILWIGTIEGGLKSLDPLNGKITHFIHDPNDPNSISSNTVSSICEDDSGNLWIGTGTWALRKGNGLNKLDRSRKQFTHYYHDPNDPASLCENNVMSLIIDKDGTLWIGTVTNKLNSIPISNLLSGDKPHFTHYTKFDDLCVWSIYEDRSGDIWFAFPGWSNYKFNKHQNSFIWYRYVEDDPYSLLGGGRLVQEDNLGNLWFGGDNLRRYNPVNGKVDLYLYDPDNPYGLSSPIVKSICEDSNGYFWIGTDRGINRLNPETGVVTHIFENPKDTFGLRSNQIRQVLLDRSGDLWVASDKSGLQLYDIKRNRFYYYDLDPDVEWETLKGMHLDQSGTLWVYTFNIGFFALKLKNYKIEYLRHYMHDPHNRNSLRENLVGDLIRPRILDTNAVWISANGLNRLDLNTQKFTHITAEDGLPSNMVLKILEDDDGNIWCTCGRDIAKYDVRSGKIRVYSDGDGLPFNGFGSRPQNACKTSDGQLIFGGGEGALGFYPGQMEENSVMPPIYLTNFRIFHESTKLDTSIQFIKTIELTHDQNVFSFEFTALNYDDPGKNQYAYKLEGLYDDWIFIGNERAASFTGMDPGEYIFRVKGSNNHGVWNEEGALVKILILPPWWATTWAYLIYAFIGLSFIYYTWTLRLKRVKNKHELEMTKFEAEKMHEVDELKSRFFANISHEFRTPLTLILGLAKKIIDKTQETASREDAGVIKRNAGRLNGLVSQILDLSKLESGNMTLRTNPLNIIPLMKGIVLSFTSFAERKRIKLKFNSAKEGIIAYIDKDKFEKIVTNLLSNAFKFTPPGGEIQFSVNRFSQNLEFSVTDTGIGISSERIYKIFDRFYQVDSSHTREQEGTGLGLALTKELVELHKGQIKVESIEGKGSIFTVILPLGKEHLKPEEIIEGKFEEEEVDIEQVEISSDLEEPKVKSELEVVTDTQKLLLLIVEDNTDVRKYIKGDLDNEYRILEAVDGEDGLNQAIEHIPDLIISDIMMPKMDGFEMCNKIKNDERTSHIPIILLTAKATEKDKISGYDKGADDYIMKPFDNFVLKSRIKNLIKQRERLKEHFINEGIFKVDESDTTSIDKKFLKKALDIIDKHISDESFSVDLLAKGIAMSRSQLRRKLFALVGKPPGDLIRTIRLTKAAHLLKQNFGNISEIAAEVGFNNPANFARTFKTHFGVSPTEYLNSKKS